MKRISKTKDPVGTVVGTIGGAAVGACAAGMLCPPLGILFGLAAFAWSKGVSKHFAAKEIDEFSLDNCDRMAETWRDTHPGKNYSARVTVTKWTDAMIPLPQTRIHTYHPDEDEIPQFPSFSTRETESGFSIRTTRCRKCGAEIYWPLTVCGDCE